MIPTQPRVPQRQTNWQDLDLHAESISHLLHWDLAYLWCLELPEAYRPTSWSHRLEAWRRLISLLITGELTLKEYDIEPPLLNYTAPFGISRQCELLYRGRPVGVTSSVVVVRPLPDFQSEDLSGLPDNHLNRAAENHYCLSLLVDLVAMLAAGEGDRSLQVSLQSVLTELRDQWRVEAENNNRPLHKAFLVETRSIPLQRAVHFDRAADDTDECTLWISKGIERHNWVPKCRICQKDMLQAEDAPAIQVTDKTFELTCADRHKNVIPIESLFIWLREEDAVCWTDREDDFPSSPEKDARNPQFAFPPTPELAGQNQVRFHWGPEATREPNRSWLTLEFPRRPVRAASFKLDAMYREIVIPGGDPKQFKGLPVRPEWLDGWERCLAVRGQANTLFFDAVRVRGIPFSNNFALSSAQLKLEPDLCLGIYPRPMYAEWRRYRAFWSGPSDTAYVIGAAAGRSLMNTVVETEQWPAYVALESASGDAGATWSVFHLAPAAPAAAPASVAAPLAIGVDFGTSNSVIYYRASNDTRQVTTADNALYPGELAGLIHWVAAADPSRATVPCFLPPKISAQDPCLFPSALWVREQDGTGLLRWGSDAPGNGFVAVHGFKWDDTPGRNGQPQDNLRLRSTYVRELFWLGLPALFTRIGLRRRALQIGFAYPLAFDFPQRRAYRQMLDEFRQMLVQDVAPNVSIVAVNESLASVRATGAFREGEWFLVADMGGRTLDLAMFRYTVDLDAQALHYIGSIDFGGESFLSAAARRKAPSADEHNDQYWRLRDAVVAGTAATGDYYQDQDLERLLKRFHPMALEFVRVMLAAFARTAGARDSDRLVIDGPRRELEPARPQPVRLLLVGNGWSLLALRAEGVDPAQYVPDRLNKWIRQFDAPVVLAGPVPGIGFLKHLVACGALQAVGFPDELANDYPSRLPTGRSMRVDGTLVDWDATCGEGGADFDKVRVTKNCSFNLLGPTPTPEWQRTLDAALPTPAHPEEQILRAHVLQAISNDKLRKGPLTLIMENHWKATL